MLLMFFGAVQIFAGSLVGGLWLLFIGMFLRGMAKEGYHGFPVTENGKVSGVVSLDEVRQVPEEARSATTVTQIMQPLSHATTIAPQASLTEALSKMGQAGSGRLLVMQDATMRGMITKTGLLRFLEIKQVLGQAGPKDSALFIP